MCPRHTRTVDPTLPAGQGPGKGHVGALRVALRTYMQAFSPYARGKLRGRTWFGPLAAAPLDPSRLTYHPELPSATSRRRRAQICALPSWSPLQLLGARSDGKALQWGVHCFGLLQLWAFASRLFFAGGAVEPLRSSNPRARGRFILPVEVDRGFSPSSQEPSWVSEAAVPYSASDRPG